ncbi:MAG: hypothetical protein US83_C0006G0068 [Candidatus Falkowbacteria bacterium GW2011_GWC2_38_22]|uniref:Lipoprotein n=1 Tax=Candidatus Falkowbacteria bacterium GW2011_GWE1_38_31 TaxID=1618638 RepID=A0A0G0JX13_9BACT|nr:MAG: hypothetical protein US73_C0001G0019 [Candidatus Falkowbacteria bacterium GW2011_GWF2_38_1205]KKQ61428.1 MAG: hypothetical protein US83_C0006G0068 [Candidatus Falkowbacteria bacterium GW2011_GWC2_38_22]KKQ63987.1 MAG: hypothetical protein US84_C0002G0019 [Candidatus Falkowbacteria bacterium GW2011_GWF1_38_22]KKQ66665.1 MAG: hypothetical protein US87_C0001G0186 [Candidatus Falkowbacteria bacterium GW2011_GWE2_38_254]KKQ71092.1 MAG: hypothetical protein US91_C0001G0019 [Candidatus Falkowb
MKKLSYPIILLFVFLTISCGNHQTSTKEEALYAVEHAEDFQEIVQYISISSFSPFPVLLDPYIHQTEPKNTINLDLSLNLQFVHQIIYKTTDGGTKLVFLSDDHPPKIKATFIIK